LIEQAAEAPQMALSQREPFRLGGATVRPGTRATVEIPVPRLLNRAELAMSVKVVHGAKPGPVLLLSAALHGDEVNGVEIILRLLNRISAKRLSGTVLAIPVVNVYGFITNSRYLPDHRDLNRSFPGSSSGSLASRLAQLFTDEVLSHATHVVDLHTGGLHRSNLPQIRACLDDPRNNQLADAFGAPVVIDAKLREGSLRAAAVKRKMPMIVYETGEALRLDRTGVLVGVRGVLGVMHSLGMIHKAPAPPRAASFRSTGSSWLRAPASGLFRSDCRLGQLVRAGQTLGVINDPLGDDKVPVLAPCDGIVIGRTNIPLVHQGDPLAHIAYADGPQPPAIEMSDLREELEDLR
jgi:predicted deacylase